ncbi:MULTISPECIES: 30S ribosomal protein S21 [Weeksellaceae]|uniref:30S ribosomal protein S21 n=1 Tax=Weeksellaceae TaxID=2762318 RepID=UPI001C55E170|nr:MULTISPECIES: 30S ribosomal protein S21 [Weeksellaceae]MBW1617373.1 30S ribosomal protein S21 [Empedobacter falsenii]
MLIIPVKDGESIERALKKYKRKFDKTGVVRQLRSRQQFTKPSVAKRQQLSRAIYKQSLLAQEEA